MSADPVREQIARMRHAAERVTLEHLKPFPPHPVAGELERLFNCRLCGRRIMVGPCFEHIADDDFVCGPCSEPETLTVNDQEETSDAAGRARTAAQRATSKGVVMKGETA